MGEFRVTAPRDTSAMGGIYGVDPMLAPPRNPARAPQVVEDIANGMVVQPAYDIGMGVGSMVGGQGWNNPEAMAGLTAAIGLLTPMKAGALGPKAGIRAYHGSPHDFDKFDLSKIGTGEGAQAYGHGLYFAENPATAQSYKTTGMNSGQSFAAEMLRRTGGNREAAMAELRKAVEANGNGTYGTDMYRHALDALEANAPLGKMYEVNINAKPEQFLDWDRPLGQQPPEIQGMLEPFRSKVEKDWSVNPTLGKPKSTGQVISGLNNIYGAPQEATAALRDAGIPGIRYLDQGSRVGPGIAGSEAESLVREFGSLENALKEAQTRTQGARTSEVKSYWSKRLDELQAYPKQTSNYVLFDDKIVDILRKYGLLGPVAAGALAGADNKQ